MIEYFQYLFTFVQQKYKVGFYKTLIQLTLR